MAFSRKIIASCSASRMRNDLKKILFYWMRQVETEKQRNRETEKQRNREQNRKFVLKTLLFRLSPKDG
jgi:hypothetical protein